MRFGGNRATESLHTYREPSVNQKINYEKLLRNASISIVKQVLEQVSKDGFSGKQHLYITFSLKHPDVQISDELKEEFEDEMTIVLQYEFWDLIVDDRGFSVNLAFDNSNEHVYVPFSSLITVSDPSEDFSLNFIPDLNDTKSQTPVQEQVTNSKVISLDAFRKKYDK